LITQNHLDIVLPCYCPAEGWVDNIIQSVADLKVLLPELKLHIILVNDGSPTEISSQSIAALERALPAFTYVQYAINKGKGHALRMGLSKSKHEICLFTDIDFPYTIESLVAIYQTLLRGEADIAVGIKGTQYYEHLPRFRVYISKLLRFFIRSFLRISITDTQCGLKGFNKAGKAIFLQTTIDRYLCDLEFIFLADRQKQLLMKPIQVVLKPGVVFSQVSLKILMAEGLNFMKVFGRSFLKLGRRKNQKEQAKKVEEVS